MTVEQKASFDPRVFTTEQQRWILEGHATSVMRQISVKHDISIGFAKMAVEAWLEGYIAATQDARERAERNATLSVPTLKASNTGA